MSDETPPLSGSLVGASLAGRSLAGVDLRGRDLTDADLSGADLSGADLSDATLVNTNLAGAGLVGARLVHAKLQQTRLDDANLTDADLSGASLADISGSSVTATGASFADVEWSEVAIRGGDWSGARLGGGSMRRVTLERLDLQGASLVGLKIEDSDLLRCSLDGADATSLVAVDTSFEDLTLRGATLENASLRFADLRAPDLTDAVLDGATLEAVDFRSPNLTGLSARGTSFERCAGLSRGQRRLLQEAGAEIPASLMERVGTVVGRLPWRLVLVGLLVLAGLAWYGLRSPGGRDRGPQRERPRSLSDLDPEDRQQIEALRLRYETEPSNRVTLLLEMGRIYDEEQLPDQAEASYREAVELLEREEQEPPVGPLLTLGTFLVGQERFDDALTYQRELDQPGASAREIAVSRLVLAMTLAARGDLERAASLTPELVQYVQEHPAVDHRFRLAAADVVEAVDSAAAAVPLVDGVPSTQPLDVQGELALERASLLARSGDVAGATEAYDFVLRAFEAMPLLRERAREERATLLRTGTDADAEERRLTELLDGEDRELAAWSAVGLARLSLRRGDVQQAEERFRDAIARFGTETPQVGTRAALELSEVLASAGRVDEAEAVLQARLEQVDDAEDTFALRQALADRRVQAGDLDGALALTREAVASAPNPSIELRAKLQLAGLADDAGRFDEAIDLYKAVAMADQDPAMTAAAWFGEATLMRRRGFPEAALPLMDGALTHLPPEHRLRAAIAVERAEVLAELGRSSPAEVERMLADARAGELEQQNPAAYASLLLLLGRELARAERHEDALNVYQQVASSPGAGADPSLREEATRGQVAALLALGRPEQAEALLDGVALDSLTAGGAEETCAVRYRLAAGKAETGNLDAALQDIEALLGTCRSPRFLLGTLPELVDLLSEADRAADAERVLAAVQRDPEVPPVGRQIAALERGKLGHPEDLEVAAAGPDAALAALARVETARRLAEAGERDQARELLDAVATAPGTEPGPRGLARIELGLLAKRQGDLGSAKVWFSQVRDDAGSEGWQKELARAELEKLQGP